MRIQLFSTQNNSHHVNRFKTSQKQQQKQHLEKNCMQKINLKDIRWGSKLSKGRLQVQEKLHAKNQPERYQMGQ